jgi:hypothetical protein
MLSNVRSPSEAERAKQKQFHVYAWSTDVGFVHTDTLKVSYEIDRKSGKW